MSETENQTTSVCVELTDISKTDDWFDNLFEAVVFAKPPISVYLTRAEDAAKLAKLTGLRVSVVFDPTEKIATSYRGLRVVAARAIARRLTDAPKQTFTAADFADVAPTKTIHNAFSYLLAKGRVTRVGRGRYRAR